MRGYAVVYGRKAQIRRFRTLQEAQEFRRTTGDRNSALLKSDFLTQEEVDRHQRQRRKAKQ